MKQLISQKSIAQLLGVNVPAISKHLKNIFDNGELVENSVVSILEIVQTEGSREVKRNIAFLKQKCNDKSNYNRNLHLICIVF